jgi:VPDSG-CTERM motif
MKRQRMMLAATTVVALLFLLTVGAPHASADVFTFTSCHLTGGCGTATNFGTVTLTQSGTSVLFDVVLTTGNRFVETGAGGGDLFVFNDALSGSTITNISATLNGATVTITGGLTGLTNQHPIRADGTGTFTAGVECTLSSSCNGGSTPNINDLHFTVTSATLAQLETPNANGNLFVADILLGQTGGTGLTGPVDVSVPPVPDGGTTLVLLGGALFGLETLRRKIRA